MNYEEIGGVLLVVAYFAFLPVFTTYIMHAKPAVCRAALLVFSALLITSVTLKYGIAFGAIVTLGITAIPAAAGLVAAVVMNGMKQSIERRHGATGITYNVRDCITGMYRALWAGDH